jgi:glycosyltransferase involved in cell wall biosynthesis
MRGVVITPLPLPEPGRDRHGVYRRLGMFLQGFRQVCDQIDIVHFAGAAQPRSTTLSDASARSSAFWQVPVSVRLAPLNERQRSWWQTGSTPFSLRYRGDFRPYLGRHQARALDDVLDNGAPAMIFAHRLPAMTSLMQLPPLQTPIFFDLDDIEHRVKQRAGQTATSPLRMVRHAVEVPALLAMERRSVARAARTFVCSPLDRSVLSGMQFDVSRVLVVPNALEIPERRPCISRDRSVLFVGNYGYAPNAQAAERLISRIWPKVRADTECASLIVAGDHPERIPSYRSSPADVLFTGFVEDLEALYRRARIVCCPIMNGGGTRLKLIEAAGKGKPIAATPVAVEGLEFRDGQHAIVQDDDHALALACTRLLQDDVLADALASAAHRKARSLYSIADLPDQIAREIRIALAGADVRRDAEHTREDDVPDRFDRKRVWRTAACANSEND